MRGFVMLLRQARDIVLAYTSQWSKVNLHTKARLGGQKIRPGIRTPIPQYIVSAGNEEK
jgi:hypothetical protein